MLDYQLCIYARKGPVIIMNQLKSIYNSQLKDSHSYPIHTCFQIIASKGKHRWWTWPLATWIRCCLYHSHYIIQYLYFSILWFVCFVLSTSNTYCFTFSFMEVLRLTVVWVFSHREQNHCYRTENHPGSRQDKPIPTRPPDKIMKRMTIKSFISTWNRVWDFFVLITFFVKLSFGRTSKSVPVI